MTELKREIRVEVKSQVLLRAGPVRPLKQRGGSGIGWRKEQEVAYDAAEAPALRSRQGRTARRSGRCRGDSGAASKTLTPRPASWLPGR